jgi:hypothetical protein
VLALQCTLVVVPGALGPALHAIVEIALQEWFEKQKKKAD